MEINSHPVVAVKTTSSWNAADSILTTQLSGSVSGEDVTAWVNSLNRAAEQVPDGSEIKLLVNFFGYEPLTTEVHKMMRTVVPLFLASHNFRAGYLGLFEDAHVDLESTRGIVCIAAAHVHHEQSKMDKYQALFGTAKEQFFTDATKALNWLVAV